MRQENHLTRPGSGGPTTPQRSSGRSLPAGQKRQTPLWVLMAPLAFFQVYLLTTVLLFRFGPWQYANRSSNEVLGFALLYQAAIVAGYLVAHLIYRRPPAFQGNVRTLIGISVLFSVLAYMPTSFARTGYFVPNVLAGLSDPGEAYAKSFEYRNSGAGAAIEYVRILLGPLLYAFFPLVVFYWSFVGWKTRLFSVVMICLTMLLFVAMGTNKALGDYAITVPLLLLTAVAAGNFRMTPARSVGAFTVVLTLAMIFSSFFSATMESRSGSFISAGYFPPGNTRVDANHPLMKQAPPEVRTLVSGISSYVTQGYFAMGLALREPFVPMYGLGTSPFVLRQYQTLTGTKDLDTLTYPSRIEKYGWVEERYWSSFYLWLASDLSFWGIPFFCFLLGLILYTNWRDAVEARNPWAVVLLSLNFIMLFYFSSNNQIGQTGESLWTYVVIFALWLSTRSGLRFVLRQR